jgi:hypothetical protein
MAGQITNNKESGFTIVELLVAGTLFLLLSLALIQIMLHGGKITETMITQVVKNNQARELFELLSDGGDLNSGYHGSSYSGGSNPITTAVTDLQLTVSGTHSTRVLDSNKFDITCDAANDRLLSCVSPVAITVNGYIDDFSTNTADRMVNDGTNDRTTEITFTVIDPYKVPRDGKENSFTQVEYSEKYWTIFTMNVD